MSCHVMYCRLNGVRMCWIGVRFVFLMRRQCDASDAILKTALHWLGPVIVAPESFVVGAMLC